MSLTYILYVMMSGSSSSSATSVVFKGIPSGCGFKTIHCVSYQQVCPGGRGGDIHSVLKVYIIDVVGV